MTTRQGHEFYPLPKKEYIHKSGIVMMIYGCNKCNSEIAYPKYMNEREVGIRIDSMKGFLCLPPVYNGAN